MCLTYWLTAHLPTHMALRSGVQFLGEGPHMPSYKWACEYGPSAETECDWKTVSVWIFQHHGERLTAWLVVSLFHIHSKWVWSLFTLVPVHKYTNSGMSICIEFFFLSSDEQAWITTWFEKGKMQLGNNCSTDLASGRPTRKCCLFGETFCFHQLKVLMFQ